MKKNIHKKLLLSLLFFITIFLFSASSCSAANSPSLTFDVLKVINPGLAGLIGIGSDFVRDSVINALSKMLSLGSVTLLGYGVSILQWVVNPNFMGSNMGITNNFIIIAGWGTVRNIANITLIFGLIVIAISIILGYQEGKAKKTLINFILIALLINFTPVICGLIVDACNIIMNSFLNSMIISNGMLTMVNNGMGPDPNGLSGFATSLIFIIFALVGFVIYLLYAILFIARYVVLWILVIASPIAFASKVFPQYSFVKKLFPSIFYWDEWWEQFLQWSIVGIVAGFSLYLSNVVMQKIVNNGTAITMAAPATGLEIFYCIVPLVFLISGFFISISYGGKVGAFVGGLATGAFAMTGGKALGWGAEKIKSGASTVIDGTGRYAAGMIPGGAAGFMSGVNEGSREAREGLMGKYDVLKSAVKGTAVGALRRKGQTEGMNYWKRAATEAAVDLHLASPDKLFKEDAAIRSAAEAEVKNMDFDDIGAFEKYSSRLSSTAKGVALEKYMEKSPDILSKLEAGPELEKRIGLLNTHGSKKAKMNALMALASTGKAGNNDELAQKLGFDVEDIRSKHGGVNDMIINKFNSKDSAKYLSDAFIKDSENLKKMNSNHFSYIAQEKGRQGVTTVNENADWNKFDDKLKKWFSDGKGAASVYNIKGSNGNNSAPTQPQQSQNPTPTSTHSAQSTTTTVAEPSKDPPTNAPGRRSV